MKNVVEENKYRIFRVTILGYPYYILEDSSKAVQKQGVWYDVKITNYYFKTFKQVKKLGDNLTNQIEHQQI